MRFHVFRSLILFGFAVINGVFFGGIDAGRAASVCGPGAHWVDGCSAGSGNFAVTVGFGIDLDLDTVPEYDVMFQGRAFIVHGNPRTSDPGNPTHLDIFPAEILSMSLAGTGGVMDGVTLLAGTDQGIAQRSSGYVLELEADPSRAWSHFNIFLELRDTPYGTLHHANDKVPWVAAEVDRYPAFGADYRHLGCCFGTFIPLYDAGETARFMITDLTDGGRPYMSLTPVPLPSALYLLVSGLFGMRIFLRRQIRI